MTTTYALRLQSGNVDGDVYPVNTTGGRRFADTYRPQDQEALVRIVNAHDAMLQKLKLYADEERTRIVDLQETETGYDDETQEDLDDQIAHHKHLLQEIEKVIAQAKGNL